MKYTVLTAFALCVSTLPALASGDAASGEKLFNKCKSCHMIVEDDGSEIVKGGKTGPNLYGVIGRTAGSVDGFRYGGDLVAAGEAGLIWTEETLAGYVKDPRGYLRETLADGKAKSKMSFKLKKGGADVAAYLASISAN